MEDEYGRLLEAIHWATSKSFCAMRDLEGEDTSCSRSVGKGTPGTVSGHMEEHI